MKTVEEARERLEDAIAATAAAGFTAQWYILRRSDPEKAHGSIDVHVDILIRAVRAEMPCYSGWSHRDCDDGTGYKCPSCKAREDG